MNYHIEEAALQASVDNFNGSRLLAEPYLAQRNSSVNIFLKSLCILFKVSIIAYTAPRHHDVVIMVEMRQETQFCRLRRWQLRKAPEAMASQQRNYRRLRNVMTRTLTVTSA